MKVDKKYIESKVRTIVEDLGFFLIDIVFRGDRNQPIFEVFIDNEKGITTDDCVSVSREVHEFMDADEDINSNYRLDVSSPGVNRPLKYLKQFTKHINREFEVKFIDDEETKKIKAKLTEINGNDLLFVKGKEQYSIPFDKIKEAKVLISF